MEKSQKKTTLLSFISLTTLILVLQILIVVYDKLKGQNDGLIKNYSISNVFYYIWILSIFVFLLFIGSKSQIRVIQNVVFTISITFVFILFLELCSFFIISTGLVETNRPDFDLIEYPFKTPTNQPFWADMNTHFGTWHYAKKYRHTSSCFDVTYTKNEHSARDKSRNLKANGKRRIVVLGDSFIEGFGIKDEDRLTNLLEAKTNIEHLNFACIASGPTKYFLNYKYLSKQFEHEVVIVCVLPNNDFSGDDIESAKKDPFWRNIYNHYWVGKVSNYELVYMTDDIKKSSWYPENINKQFLNDHNPNYKPQSELTSFDKKILFFLKHCSSIYNLVISKSNEIQSNSNSKYYDFSNEEFDRLCFSLIKIKEECQGKEMIVLNLPILNDLVVFSNKNFEPPLIKRMTEFCSKNNLKYIDLLIPFMHSNQPPNDLFFPRNCDGNTHWSIKGNKLASEILLQSKVYRSAIGR